MSHQKGTYGKLNILYLLNRIANIFSMHELEQQYRITDDSWKGYYSVQMPRGVVKFHKDKQGLPYIDLDRSSQEAATMLMQVIQTQGAQECAEEGTIHMQTVQGNFKGYAKHEIIQAKEARKAQAMTGNPSNKDFKRLVSNHLVSNCPITYADITNAPQIFGPVLASIWGKTVCRMHEPVVADYVAVPQSLMERIKVVTLAGDIFFVDRTAFMITVSQKIKFVTEEHVLVRTAASLVKYLNQVIQVYFHTGFVVRTLMMDGEFENINFYCPWSNATRPPQRNMSARWSKLSGPLGKGRKA
jgi:hypothetical protein